MVYPSRISVPLAVIIIAMMSGAFGFIIYLLATDPFDKKEVASLSLVLFEMLIACLVVYGVLFRTHYVIEGDKLEVKVAILHAGEGHLKNLESIMPTRSILSAPACSFKRIRLDFSDGTTLVISPRFQDEFLAEIKKINPKVHIDETLC